MHQQGTKGHNFFPTSSSHSHFFHQQKQRHQQQLQHLQQVQRQHIQAGQVNPPQLQQQLQQQLLQQHLHQQQHLQQHQQQKQVTEQQAVQRGMRLQLQQNMLLEGHGSVGYPLQPEVALECYSCSNKWMGLSCNHSVGGDATAATASSSAAAVGAATPAIPAFPSTPHAPFKPTSATEGSQRANELSDLADPRRLTEDGGTPAELPLATTLEMWQAKQVLSQRESRPLRLTRFEMVEAYAKCKTPVPRPLSSTLDLKIHNERRTVDLKITSSASLVALSSTRNPWFCETKSLRSATTPACLITLLFDAGK